MNKDNAKDYFPHVQALADGELEVMNDSGAWEHCENTTFCYEPSRYRRRPATFESHGKTWTWHKPGDPMPCDGDKLVDIYISPDIEGAFPDKGKEWHWGEGTSSIIGWRYADKPAEPVMVPLGPEDVPPGSVIRWCGEEYWQAIVGTEPNGVYRAHNDTIELVTWKELDSPDWQIKRPTDTDWQPCSKPQLPTSETP